MDKDKLKISELQKEVQEFKEENKNLNWMLTKQFDNSFNQVKLSKIQKELIADLLSFSLEFDSYKNKKYKIEGEQLLQKLYNEGHFGTKINKN
tara:strand:+ start:201 stop:479 length:279 start_codon:yes stop_codon:yes gene_type:complete